jgi:hypothetical protein
MPAIIRLETGTREMEIFSDFVTQAGCREWPDPADLLEADEVLSLDEREYIYCIEQCWAVGHGYADDFDPEAVNARPLPILRPAVALPGFTAVPGVGERKLPRDYSPDQRKAVVEDIQTILDARSKGKTAECLCCGRDSEHALTSTFGFCQPCDDGDCNHQ